MSEQIQLGDCVNIQDGRIARVQGNARRFTEYGSEGRELPLGELWSFSEVKSSAVEVIPAGEKPMPISKAMEDDSLLAYLMNDEILTVEHGLPVRVFLSGWVGRISWKSDNIVISAL